MICKICGKEISNDDNFCPYCGATIDHPQKVEPQQPQPEVKVAVQPETPKVEPAPTPVVEKPVHHEQKVVKPAPAVMGGENEAVDILKKILFPASIVAGAITLLWMLFAFIWGVKISSMEDPFSGMYTAQRVFAIIDAFVVLIIFGVLTALTVIRFTKTNKSNLKSTLPTNIINGIVCVILFVLFIVLMTKVFDEDDWSNSMFKAGCAIMGSIFALSAYIIIACIACGNAKYNNYDKNAKQMNIIGKFITVTVAAMTLPWLFTMIYGFKKGDEKIFASFFMAKFVIGMLVVLAFAALINIGLTILKNKDADTTKDIIFWSILGGVLLVLWIVGVVLCDFDKCIEKQKMTGATVVVLLSWLFGIAGGVCFFIRDKNAVASIAK